MKLTRKLALGAAALCLAGAGFIAAASAAREFPIGSITYEARPEREVVNVGGEDFQGIRFEVRQSDVEVLDIRVVYDNGRSEDIRVRQRFRAGTSSRVYDLNNQRRGVRQVIVNYVPDGSARIMLFGVSGGGGGGGNIGGGDWVRLGCKDVRFLVDRDTLKVGREGRFAALRLKARNAPVEMFSLRVSFLNGARLDVPVREVLLPGMPTRPIELMGNNRGIDRIEMVYRSIPTNKGTAEVCIDGLDR